MILMIDNYDSFTYNLYQELGMLYPDIKVVRNDEITIEEIEKLAPQALIVSPGPCYPKQAGISVEAIKHFSGKLPILGVCLGHQSIGEAFGGNIVHAEELMHGKKSNINVNTNCLLFDGLPKNIEAARYHSLVIEKESLPDCLEITAEDDIGQIMAVKHKEHPTYGVQFHPESILTEVGLKILSNFLNNIVGIKTAPTKIASLPDSERVELKPFVKKVVEGNNLTEEEAYSAMNIIMSDKATNAQIAAFLTALRMKGETIEEITAFAKVMRSKMTLVKPDAPVLDIVGTGGDLSNSFNISTTSGFVIAGAGQNVAKHGNRSVSSKSGAADVLEALGVKIASTPEKAEACINEVGISFLFAQSYHSAMRFVGPTRKQIGIRTIFNILGPLSNPAKADYMILGVYAPKLLEPLAHVLKNLGVKAAMLVYGNDCLDEISISDSTSVCEIKDDKITSYEIAPEDFGLKRAPKDAIKGGDAKDNAKITLGILDGTIQDSKRDVVLL
ncbi:MAG: bifunctional anthranilate synthase component II/anthranilate phosphoribosyltransferase, partial [Oscillospiraceae bacterium]